MKHVATFLLVSLITTFALAQPKEAILDHYLFSVFKDGVILFKNGKKENHWLNYNTLSEEMVFDNKGKKLAMSPYDVVNIDTIYIERRKFVALNDKFVEVVHRAKWNLFLAHKCKLEIPGTQAGYGRTTQNSASHTLPNLMENGLVYNMKLPEEYKTSAYTTYWLQKGDTLDKFMNANQLKKLYSEQKDKVKEYLKTHDLKYSDQKSIVDFILHMDNITSH